METTTAPNPMTPKVSHAAKRTLLILSSIMCFVGGCGGPLITRLYFIYGGNHIWLTSFIQTGGFPVVALVLIILYFQRRATQQNDNNTTKATPIIFMGPRLFFSAAFIGFMAGAECYLYSYGISCLPVSTTTLIISAQLCSMAFFTYVLVQQKFTPFSINAIFLLTVGAGVLAMHSSSDRPAGESKKEYLIGFVMTVAAALLIGISTPMVELAYKKAKQTITFTILLEFQLVMCIFATAFSTVGMIVNNDFKEISKEATQFELGETKYYTILCVCTLVWQCNFLGTIGVIFSASSLMSGIIGAVLLPITEVLAIVFYKEKFQVEKGVSLILALWGLASYLYGEFKFTKKSKDITYSSQQLKDLAQSDNLSI